MTSVRILVIRGGTLRDLIVTIPVLKALRDRWPDAQLELAGYPRFADLARAGGLVDEVRPINNMLFAKLFSLRPEFAESERDDLQSYSFIISYIQDFDQTLSTNLENLGVAQVLYKSPLVQGDFHATEYLFSPLNKLAIYYDMDGGPARLATDAFPRDEAQVLLQKLGLKNCIVALSPGQHASPNNWPDASYIKLYDQLKAGGMHPFFFVAEDDVAAVKDAEKSGATVIVEQGLEHAAALLGEVDVFVGNGGGFSHLAAAVGTSTLSLFSKEDPDLWAPQPEHGILLMSSKGDWSDVHQDDVLAAVSSLLNEEL